MTLTMTIRNLIHVIHLPLRQLPRAKSRYNNYVGFKWKTAIDACPGLHHLHMWSCQAKLITAFSSMSIKRSMDIRTLLDGTSRYIWQLETCTAEPPYRVSFSLFCLVTQLSHFEAVLLIMLFKFEAAKRSEHYIASGTPAVRGHFLMCPY